MENRNNFFIFESRVVTLFDKITIPLARFALFLVYFWFGILKVLDMSPATPMVSELLNSTVRFIEPVQFLVFFGLFEMLIGVLFLIPRFTKVAIALLFIHMFTTVLPLFILPQYTWSNLLVPTLEGQYIIKNILIIALAIVLGAHLKSKLIQQS